MRLKSAKYKYISNLQNMLTKINILEINQYFHWLLINDLSKRVVALM